MLEATTAIIRDGEEPVSALSLYDRVGFRSVGGNDSHVRLEWRQTR